MPEGHRRDRLDVVARDVEPVVEDRPDLGRQDDRLRPARARPVSDVLLGHHRGPLVLRVGRQDQGDPVPSEVVRDRDLPGELAHLRDPLAVEDRLGPGIVPLGRPIEDRLDLLGAGELDQELEEEPVELGFRERVRPLLLERVLGREHEERPAELVRLAADGDGFLLHRLEQGRLRLGRGPVDLVGEHQIGEHRPGLELEFPAPLGVLDDHVGADQVGGHQVGRELDPRELHPQGVGQGPDQQGLAQPRDPFEEHVPARHQRRQGAFHDVLVADDHLGDLGPEGVEPGAEFLELLLQFLDLRHEIAPAIHPRPNRHPASIIA